MYVDQLRQIDVDWLVNFAKQMDLAPGPGGSRITYAPVPFPNLWPILDEGADIVRLGFVALYPSQQIVAHCDEPIRETRYHIPIQMNPGCWVFHDGTWQQLELGRLYTMDPAQWHGAVNWGDTLRIHLMMDVGWTPDPPG